MKNWKESPCACCQRVANPQACDNKDCMRWRRWFIHRWEQLREIMGKQRCADELEK